MIENFIVNDRLKKEIKHNKKRNSNKYWFLRVIKKIFFVTIFITPSVFTFYAYRISKGFVYLNDRYAPIGTKNSLYILTIAVTMFVLLLFFYLILNMIYDGLINRVINRHFSESLVYNNGILKYGYKLKMQSYTDERVLVNIPLDAVKYSIDAQNKEILFEGSIFSQFYTDYKNGVINGKGDYISDIVLYDYFEPSLISFLTNKDNIKGVTYYE